jgi:hypothetical protein
VPHARVVELQQLFQPRHRGAQVGFCAQEQLRRHADKRAHVDARQQVAQRDEAAFWGLGFFVVFGCDVVCEWLLLCEPNTRTQKKSTAPQASKTPAPPQKTPGSASTSLISGATSCGLSFAIRNDTSGSSAASASSARSASGAGIPNSYAAAMATKRAWFCSSHNVSRSRRSKRNSHGAGAVEDGEAAEVEGVLLLSHGAWAAEDDDEGVGASLPSAAAAAVLARERRKRGNRNGAAMLPLLLPLLLLLLHLTGLMMHLLFITNELILDEVFTRFLRQGKTICKIATQRILVLAYEMIVL